MTNPNKHALEGHAKEQYEKSSSARVDQAMRRMEQEIRSRKSNTAPRPPIQENK